MTVAPTTDRTTGLKRWIRRIVALVIVVPVLALAVWTAGALMFSYSKGDRAGFVQKFSKRGWLCKTWEGELAMVNMPGSLADRFEFTVRDGKVAEQLNASMGQRVVLTYEQHKGLPTTCFGDTEYFVTAVRTAEP
jgi:hypothetical protein